jgi:PAS domain S-box-containing protein
MLKTKYHTQTSGSDSDLKIAKVLLVSMSNDDHVLIKTLISESYYSEKYNIDWCENYANAINAMLKKHYDLYLVDYKLGEYTGIDLLHEAIYSNCMEPIILLSDNTNSTDDEKALRIGATYYLIKTSIDGHTLERSMRYALEHNIELKNLRGNENKFRTIFEKSIYPIIISDSAGVLYDANPAAVKFFELPLEKLLNENANNFYSDEEQKYFIDAMENKGTVNDMEVTLRLPNGKIKYCSISSFVQISQHGTSVYYHSIIHDLTSRKQQESIAAERIAKSERLAKSLANEIQDPLLNANLALNALTTNLNGHTSEPLKLYLNIVKENFERIDQLTKNLFQSVSQPLD